MYPTWNDVGVPEIIVNCLKKGHPQLNSALDFLVTQLVYGKPKTPIFLYTCHACHYRYSPNRASEEYTTCHNCQGHLIGCYPHCKFKDINIVRVNDLVAEMRKLYVQRFREPIAEIVDCGWGESGTYAKFAGGDMVLGPPRQCLMRAALACPYVWEPLFTKDDAGERLPHILSVFAGAI